MTNDEIDYFLSTMVIVCRDNLDESLGWQQASKGVIGLTI